MDEDSKDIQSMSDKEENDDRDLHDEEEEDEEEEIMNAQEQLFIQQQMEQEYLNAFGEESDDGLILAGGDPN